MFGLMIFFFFLLLFLLCGLKLFNTEYEMRDTFANESTEMSVFVWKAMLFCHRRFLGSE